MKFNWKGKEWYIDGYLASQLDSLAYNVKDDWDFVIIISGDRMVRVGKSVLALTICAYLCYSIQKLGLSDRDYNIDDIYFENEDLITAAFTKPKYSINHYDEGREGLAANKAMKQFQQQLMDFFTECGQLNHIFVIVAPDYFELKEDIAVGRSEVLINVYRKEESKEMDIYKEGKKIPITKFSRGYFQFFSRNKKAQLYDNYKSRRRKSYFSVKPNFIGRFTNQYPVDEEEYKKKKKDSLTRFNQRKERDNMPAKRKSDVVRDKVIMDLKLLGKNGREISEEMARIYDFEITEQTVNKIIAKKS